MFCLGGVLKWFYMLIEKILFQKISMVFSLLSLTPPHPPPPTHPPPRYCKRLILFFVDPFPYLKLDVVGREIEEAAGNSICGTSSCLYRLPKLKLRLRSGQHWIQFEFTQDINMVIWEVRSAQSIGRKLGWFLGPQGPLKWAFAWFFMGGEVDYRTIWHRGQFGT